VAGGPNSMRGWQIRKLGIGSNISFDTTLDGRLNDKYADIQLEGNLEYRFNLFPFYGFWMRGAVFTDIGNIWFRNDLSGQLPQAGFRAGSFYKDLAMASGFGVRVDFSYFLLRFDLGFPLKDPRYGPQNTGSPQAERYYSPRPHGWFVPGVWDRPVFQFAIGYPF
jgi:outer membrane protein assembly factor BamA